jgi:Pectinacetylesterase
LIRHLSLLLSLSMAMACGGAELVNDVDAGGTPPENLSAGGQDAGRPDAGDAGVLDAGKQDAGVSDGGDAGTADAGDAGGGDAGGYYGTPIEIPSQAPYDTWTWVPIPDTYCGNGTPTGLGINPHAGSSQLLIFLAGGGMCFDYLTCFVKQTASNLDGFSATELAGDIAELDDQPGGLNRADSDNPFKAYNYVVLPYCTGDIFAGTQQTTYHDPLGGAHVMDHVGHLDIEAYLQVLVPTFAATQTQVVFGGSSAGGFGALINYDLAATAFAPTPVLMIDDSGPPMRNPYLATSLLTTVWDAWGMGSAVPQACTTCTIDDGMSGIVSYLTATPSFRGSLISSEQDEVIKDFLTIGNPLMQFGWYYQIGLNDLYDNVIETAGPGQLRVFFIQSSQHVWFVFNDLGQVTSGGVTLAQFLTDEITPDAGFSNVLP